MRNLAAAPILAGEDGSPPRWRADRLVFVNDVYFCARDVARLLQHGGADVACAMDFLAYKGPPSTADVHPYGIDGPPLSVRAAPSPPPWLVRSPNKARVTNATGA